MSVRLDLSTAPVSRAFRVPADTPFTSVRTRPLPGRTASAEDCTEVLLPVTQTCSGGAVVTAEVKGHHSAPAETAAEGVAMAPAGADTSPDEGTR